MEIQVGEYVRVNNGFIAKVELVTDVGIRTNNRGIVWIDKRTIKKHSFNIIDLIEKGDYVNGYPIVKLKNGKLYSVDFCVEDQLEYVALENIDLFDTIVTHEQFDSVKYEVE